MLCRYGLLALIFLLSSTPLYADLNTADGDRARGDFTAAANEYRRLAEAGDPVAQVNLGYMYYVGEGVAQDYGQALAWYNEAASHGNADAQYNLAVAYAFGEGVSQNFTTAVEWYRAAANQGHAVAQFSLGLSYAYGEGVDRDPAEAASWFAKSAEQGYVRAQTLLGSKYHTGDGVALDYEAAVRWYRLAAEQGDAMAQFNLAGMYRSGNGVTKDNNEALNWYRKAADQGYSAASAELASMERTSSALATEPVSADLPVPESSLTAPEEMNIAAEMPTSEATMAVPEVETSYVEITTQDMAESPSVEETVPAQPAAEKIIDYPAEADSKPANLPAESNTSTATLTNETFPVQTTTPDISDYTPAAEVEITATDLANDDQYFEPAQNTQARPASTAELIQNQLANLNRSRNEIPASGPSAQTSETVITPIQPDIAPTSTALESADDAGLMSMDNINPDLPDTSSLPASALLVETSTATSLTENADTPPTNDAAIPVTADIENEQSETGTGSEQQTPPADESKGGFFSRLFGRSTPTESTPESDIDGHKSPAESEPFVTEMAPDMEIEAKDAGMSSSLETPELLYETGLNEYKNKNFGTALNNFRSAAVRGHPLSQYQLGLALQQGIGTSQDNEEAALWYRRAAEQGVADAQYNLGNMYLLGEGIVQDDTQARHWYGQAAGQGHAGAIHNLQNLSRLNPVPLVEADSLDADSDIMSGSEPLIESILPDPVSSDMADVPVEQISTPLNTIETPNPSDTNDNYVAKLDYERGLAYSFGEGVSKDLPAAFSFFKKAADNNHAPAQYKLGVAYAYGEGTTQDLAQAVYWYEKAAMQGHAIAQRNLGLSYQNGTGTGINRPLALAWFSILADRGNVMDIRRKESMAGELGIEEINQAETLKADLMNRIQGATR